MTARPQSRRDDLAPLLAKRRKYGVYCIGGFLCQAADGRTLTDDVSEATRYEWHDAAALCSQRKWRKAYAQVVEIGAK